MLDADLNMRFFETAGGFMPGNQPLSTKEISIRYAC
jgi:hypothetical protein